jgi:hypothetical protein
MMQYGSTTTCAGSAGAWKTTRPTDLKSKLSHVDLLTNLLTLATRTDEKHRRNRAMRMSQVVEEQGGG